MFCCTQGQKTPRCTHRGVFYSALRGNLLRSREILAEPTERYPQAQPLRGAAEPGRRRV